MKRVVVAATAALLGAIVATPSLAATRTVSHATHFTDPAGDWVVPSEDITGGTITSTAKTLTIAINLSAAPMQGVVTRYTVVLYPSGPSQGCNAYDLVYDWTGVNQTATTALDYYANPACDTVQAATQATPTVTYPATATATSNGVRFTLPTIRQLRPGTRVAFANFFTSVSYSSVAIIAGARWIGNGDYATTGHAFVLGS